VSQHRRLAWGFSERDRKHLDAPCAAFRPRRKPRRDIWEWFETTDLGILEGLEGELRKLPLVGTNIDHAADGQPAQASPYLFGKKFRYGEQGSHGAE